MYMSPSYLLHFIVHPLRITLLLHFISVMHLLYNLVMIANFHFQIYMRLLVFIHILLHHSHLLYSSFMLHTHLRYYLQMWMLALSYRNVLVLYYNFMRFNSNPLYLHLLDYYLLLILCMSYYSSYSIHLVSAMLYFMLMSKLMLHLYMPLLWSYMLVLLYLYY